MLPDFLIIGAMKSGTTSLRWYLDEHPQAACIRETHFFDLHFDRGQAWYEEQFAEVDPSLIVGEKTPDYLADEYAPDRMKAVVPEAKLIAILRNPVTRAYSHYWHMRRVQRESLSFEEALRAEQERVRAKQTHLGYFRDGLYAEQLRRFAERYPRENMLVLLFEELKEDPQTAFKSACRFLKIDDSIPVRVVGNVANKYRQHRPLWLWNFMHKRHLWRRLPKSLADGLAKRMTVDTEYPQMTPATARLLSAEFEPHNRELARWLGRDLRIWELNSAQYARRQIEE